MLNFHPNRFTHGGVMTLYRFFKMPAMAWQIYFRLRVWRQNSFEKDKIYPHTKFRWDNSIDGRDVWPFTPKLFAFIENPIWRRPPSWIHSTLLLEPREAMLVVRRRADNFVLIGPPIFEICGFSTSVAYASKCLFPPILGRFFGGLTP